MDNNQEITESKLHIDFGSPGSVFYQVSVDGLVYPAQLVFIGEYLRTKGLQSIEVAERIQMEKEKEQRIAVPKPKIVTTR